MSADLPTAPRALRPAVDAVPRRLVVLSAGVRQPSSTRLLADRLADATVAALAAVGVPVAVTVVELRDHARDLTSMMLTGVATPSVQTMLDTVAGADAVIAVTPIYTGSYPGMFKDAVDLLAPDALAGVPVLVGATAGTGRHALALEYAVRPLFGHLHAVVVPTGVVAATEDFGEVAGSSTADERPLAQRVERAAHELAALVAARPPAAPPADPFALTTSFEDLLRGR
ncbi:CE1759 family FMN reductase [Actinotalea sp.]|uniref:CE1759 family FMN reductase n=1 Tax=Actinotalea sp. TaxID=1872145 RepID=UPI002C8A336D|nr:CE1759 family FMN reductase [Actinotalea sp.]HQY34373.1 NAD(P)H-dependent oxidoreductase [Actinotalea sp.]HRA50304.1 NAD(P)H-dependent oxidoreductase [Actinotalea sp.]